MTRSMCPQAQVNVPWAFVKTSDNKEMSSTGKRKLKLKQTEAIQMGKVGDSAECRSTQTKVFWKLENVWLQKQEGPL